MKSRISIYYICSTKKPEYIVALLTLFFFLTTATLLIIIKVKNHLNSEMAKVAYLDSVTGTGQFITNSRSRSLVENQQDYPVCHRLP